MKMQILMYQVDAFTSKLFAGNPAAVCLLDSWIEDEILLCIAEENNLSETAFLVKNYAGYEIRWFTPVSEVDLCGHATLASAFVLFNCLDRQESSVKFITRKSGELSVTKKGELLEMDFPAKPPTPREVPEGLIGALGIPVTQVLGSAEDLLVVLRNEDEVRNLKPDIPALARLDHQGIIVTARGDKWDFVSRFFAPRFGIPEDPVTGSAHCVLTPYWTGLLCKRRLRARQLSKRGGELFCEERGDRVGIAGNAVLYFQGTLWL